MEFIIVNKAPVPVPREIEALGRAAIGEWTEARVAGGADAADAVAARLLPPPPAPTPPAPAEHDDTADGADAPAADTGGTE